MSFFRKGILQYLINSGKRVMVIAPPDFKSQELIDMGCEYYPLPFQTKTTSPIRDIGLFFKILKLYLKLKPDIVFQYTIKPNIYGSLAAKFLSLKCIPVVTGLGYAFTTKSWINWLVRKFYQISFLTVKQVWFLNIDDVNLFTHNKLIPVSKSKILPSEGVDTKYFAYSPITNTQPTFLLIARMLWDKGVMDFVEAAKLVKAQYPNFKFQLLGPTGSDNPNAIPLQLIEHWQHDGLIEYLGVSENVTEQILNATCVVLPSYREGVSKVLMEAASIGRPLIATYAAGCKEVIEHGVTGYLCEVKHPQSLATQMIKIGKMSLPQLNQMGLAGREKMMQEFDEKLVIDFYMEAIRLKKSNDQYLG